MDDANSAFGMKWGILMKISKLTEFQLNTIHERIKEMIKQNEENNLYKSK